MLPQNQIEYFCGQSADAVFVYRWSGRLTSATPASSPSSTPPRDTWSWKLEMYVDSTLSSNKTLKDNKLQQMLRSLQIQFLD